MEENIVYVERKRDLWVRIIAAFLYTFATFCLAYAFYFMEFSMEKRYLRFNFDALQIGIYAYFIAFYCSYTVNCYYNFKQKLFKREIAIGIFKYGKWKNLPELDYISVFSTNHNVYHINLWYKKNRHWNLYEKYDYEDAFIIALELSEELNIDLLDATVRNDYKWIDLEASKTQGKIIYLD